MNFVRDDWDLYAEGFHMGAETLIQKVIDSGGRDVDFLIYPIVFCFRHAIELQLKAAVHWERRYLGKPTRVSTKHELVGGDELWNECRSLAEEIWSNGSTNELDEAEKILREIEAHDRIGEAFRYPVDTKGRRTKPTLTHINIPEFYEGAERAYSLLDGIATGCEAMWQERMGNEMM